MGLKVSKRAFKNKLPIWGIPYDSTLANILLVCSDFSAVVISTLGMLIGLLISSLGREDLTPLVGSLPEGKN